MLNLFGEKCHQYAITIMGYMYNAKLTGRDNDDK